MRGLWNLGNTCYFNTAVQCLAHVPPLTKYLFDANLSGCSCDITKEYQKVVKQLFIKGETRPVSPSDLLGAFRVRFPRFEAGHQHDAQEVVLVLIDVFEESLGKEFIMDLFNGEETQETSWKGGSSKIVTPFTTLILDVTEPCRLQDLIEEKQKSILIQNYKDEEGGEHPQAEMSSQVSRWPKFINFSFSMYDYKFPIEIPFEFEGRKLFACIMHQGHKQGGHYALLVRRYDKWYIKDDGMIHEVPDISIMKGEFYQCWYRPIKSLAE
jgi:ubiquitin C-terminal hydrolase